MVFFLFFIFLFFIIFISNFIATNFVLGQRSDERFFLIVFSFLFY